jgi:micrococcal nuclease
MLRRCVSSLLLTLLGLVLMPWPSEPHGGGLDSYGCHQDRKQGEYHCHRGQFAGRSFPSQAEMQAARQENYTAIPPTLPSIHFTGKVVGVSDGDTISVMHNGRGQKIRLHGIDCPEKGQAFGQRAKQFTSALVFGKEVTVTVKDTDKYGRTIGEVKLLDGTVLNQELVKAGLAWWYRRYAPGDTVLEGLEKGAREAKQGLWVEPNPVPPWEWRHRKALR